MAIAPCVRSIPFLAHARHQRSHASLQLQQSLRSPTKFIKRFKRQRSKSSMSVQFLSGGDWVVSNPPRSLWEIHPHAEDG
eukprot:440481-Amphidinium_carterae.1